MQIVEVHPVFDGLDAMHQRADDQSPAACRQRRVPSLAHPAAAAGDTQTLAKTLSIGLEPDELIIEVGSLEVCATGIFNMYRIRYGTVGTLLIGRVNLFASG